MWHFCHEADTDSFVTTGDPGGSEPYYNDVPAATLLMNGMTTRSLHTATLLLDGSVLIAGGSYIPHRSPEQCLHDRYGIPVVKTRLKKVER